MKRLLQIEFNKIFPYKIARIFLISYILILIMSAVFLSREMSLFGLKIELAKMGIFDAPNVWHFITYFAAIAKLFLAIILITTLANEFSYGTLKQNLIDGLTKKEFILSKTLTSFIFALGSTLLVFLIALTLGLIFSDTEMSIFSEFSYVPAYFLKLLTFFSFCTFICVLLRKSALALGLLFIWWIFESILSGIEFVIRHNLFNTSLNDIKFMFTNYLPLTAMSNLIPSPFKRIKLIDMATQGGLNDLNIDPVYFVVCFAYFVLFTWLSYRLIKWRDL